MNIKNPKISVLVPSYNHEKYAAEFIESVLLQVEQDFELIIVDDASTDGTVKEIEKFRDKRIKLIKHEFNKGINVGLNSAFKAVSGKYCVLIASDDKLFANHLECVSKILDADSSVDVVYCSSQPIDEKGNIIKGVNRRENRSRYEILQEAFLRGNPLSSPGMTVRKSAFDKIYPLHTSVLQRQDYKMHIELLLNGNCHILQQPLVYYRIGNNNTSKSTLSVVNTKNLEESCLMDSFLNIKDVKILKYIFGDKLKEFGEPVNETIPYFLGRLALTSSNELKQLWGYHVIMKYINHEANTARLSHLYGFNFNNFISLNRYFANSRLSIYLSKIKKYRKLFRAALILLALSFLINIFLMFR